MCILSICGEGEAVIRPLYAAYARCIYGTLSVCIKVTKPDILGKQEACHKSRIAAKCCSASEQTLDIVIAP